MMSNLKKNTIFNKYFSSNYLHGVEGRTVDRVGPIDKVR
jgi:hypothetical protein